MALTEKANQNQTEFEYRIRYMFTPVDLFEHVCPNRRWVGYSEAADTWEPATSLPAELVEEFHDNEHVEGTRLCAHLLADAHMHTHTCELHTAHSSHLELPREPDDITRMVLSNL